MGKTTTFEKVLTKIYASTVRHFTRLFKEHKSYILEEEQQKIKVDKFVADGAEDWDIKNGVCPCIITVLDC